jgi:hypothetical protein
MVRAQMMRRVVRAGGWLALGTALACNNQVKEQRSQLAASATASTAPSARTFSTTTPSGKPALKISDISLTNGGRAIVVRGHMAELLVNVSGRNLFYLNDAGTLSPPKLTVEAHLPEGAKGNNGVEVSLEKITLDAWKRKQYHPVSEEIKLTIRIKVASDASLGTRSLVILSEEGKELDRVKYAFTIRPPKKAPPRYPETTNNPCEDLTKPIRCKNGWPVGWKKK